MPLSPGVLPDALPTGLKAAGTAKSRTALPPKVISRTVGFCSPAAARWPSLLQTSVLVAAL